MFKHRTAKTFQEYSDIVFVPNIQKWLGKVSRVDVVCDVYLQSSLKSSTRERRGKGKTGFYPQACKRSQTVCRKSRGVTLTVLDLTILQPWKALNGR